MRVCCEEYEITVLCIPLFQNISSKGKTKSKIPDLCENFNRLKDFQNFESQLSLSFHLGCHHSVFKKGFINFINRIKADEYIIHMDMQIPHTLKMDKQVYK